MFLFCLIFPDRLFACRDFFERKFKIMKQNTKKLTTIGILSAISFVLMMIEFPLPLMPPFLKFDLSTVPALIAGFMFGPIGGILVALVKDLLHLLMTSTGGVGELADFLCTGIMVLCSSLVYLKYRTKKGALIGLCVGIFGLLIVSSLTNAFLLLPLYLNINPVETLPYITGAILPFNFVKGVILSVVTFILYKNISRILK